MTLSDDGECPALLISCGIIDLGAFCVELWSFFVSKEKSVPMSYTSLREHLLILPIAIIEFGPCPIYAHGSSFLPNPGMMMIMIISRAEITIIIVNRVINYNCKSDSKL